MGRVSQGAVRRPWYALVTWAGIMILVGLLSVRFGGDYNDNFELPDTESTTAQNLLADLSEAERLFRVYGYSKTTVADIADAARMSPANVYRFFASKSDINNAICERIIAGA